LKRERERESILYVLLKSKIFQLSFKSKSLLYLSLYPNTFYYSNNNVHVHFIIYILCLQAFNHLHIVVVVVNMLLDFLRPYTVSYKYPRSQHMHHVILSSLLTLQLGHVLATEKQ
jgi:hypothetical protein